jgi:hypothetical protein
VVQFLDGIQILIYMSLTYISKLWWLRCNSYIKRNTFPSVWIITRDFPSFYWGSSNTSLKKSNRNLEKPLMINQTVWNMSGTLYQNYKKHSHCIRQPAMPVNSIAQQYVPVNTKVSYPYLSAVPSVSFSHYTLRSHIKHTVCVCVCVLLLHLQGSNT